MKMSWIAPLFLLFILIKNPLHANSKEEIITFRVNRSDYFFSSIFDMTNEKAHYGSIVKSFFHLTTHYDSYDRFGLYEGQGICRMATLGFFYAWATKIDLYNVHGNKMGVIYGEVMSAEPAKFSFYDVEGNRICIAYLDQNCMGFVFVDPINPTFVLARLTRNFILDAIDHWDFSLYYPDRLPLKFMKVFAAFACDTQDKFKPDL